MGKKYDELLEKYRDIEAALDFAVEDMQLAGKCPFICKYYEEDDFFTCTHPNVPNSKECWIRYWMSCGGLCSPEEEEE